ncbi:MAG: hypothetical protein Q7U36_01860 [bacterium]|nr:hypothetical protein [bacterium]
MKKKKKISDWQIALVHWLLAGIFAPFLFSAIFGQIVKGIANNFGVIVWLAILGEAVKFFLVWTSIIYSAKFINKTFVIKNNINIVRISTIYLCVFLVVFRILFFDGSSVMNYIFSSMHLVSLLVVIPFFYFFSKNQIGNIEKPIKKEV